MAKNKNNITNDELVKVNDGEIDNVAGGKFWKDEDYDDGHEKSCFARWHFSPQNLFNVCFASIKLARAQLPEAL